VSPEKAQKSPRRSGWLSVLRRCLPRRWPAFDSRSRPDLRLEWKRWLFSVTLRQGARSQALQLRLYNGFAVAQAKVSHILRPAWVRVGRGIPHVKGHNIVLRLSYSKEYMLKKLTQKSLPFGPVLVPCSQIIQYKKTTSILVSCLPGHHDCKKVARQINHKDGYCKKKPILPWCGSACGPVEQPRPGF
jgi:hypothetical protein